MSRGIGVALWAATAVAAFGIGWITPPPHRPLAPDDLVASLRSALGEGDVIERQGRTSSLLERLDPTPDPVPGPASGLMLLAGAVFLCLLYRRRARTFSSRPRAEIVCVEGPRIRHRGP
jgi:hypothetical protein